MRLNDTPMVNARINFMLLILAGKNTRPAANSRRLGKRRAKNKAIKRTNGK
jgi:hypothetical protein